MRVTEENLRRIIKEGDGFKGWFLLSPSGGLAKSQKTRTPIWWNEKDDALAAYNNGYGNEGSIPVEVLLVHDTYAYNGYNADPADLAAVTGQERKNDIHEGIRRQIRKMMQEASNLAYGPAVPLTSRGKVDLKALTDDQLSHYEEGYDDAVEGHEPRDTMSLKPIASRSPADQAYTAGYSDGVRKADEDRDYKTLSRGTAAVNAALVGAAGLGTAFLESAKSTKKYDDNPALKGGQSKLPDHLQKGIIAKNLDEDDTPHEPQYDAPQGSKRDKQLDATKADLASGDPKRKARAYRRRERMERKERKKNESVTVTESELRQIIREVFLQEELSKATKETLKKKAEKRGLTPGSVYAEFKKGLAAWASSGSRKGMSQHQWAHARVNSATPSKSWAVVKKSKAKKK
jgi:hypothetical protein